jgi:hypothetical protein
MNGLIFAETIISPIINIKAYLDPGSGSFILQIILATLLGGLIILRSFWTKIKNGVSQIFTRNRDKDVNEKE